MEQLSTATRGREARVPHQILLKLCTVCMVKNNKNNKLFSSIEKVTTFRYTVQHYVVYKVKTEFGFRSSPKTHCIYSLERLEQGSAKLSACGVVAVGGK